MDLDQIKTFDRIAQDLSFTKAAARLNVTQATVSMRMRALEDLLGVPLFHRGRKVTLTDQGMTFLPYARRILSTAQEAREALRRADRGRITLACLRSLVSPLVTDSLVRFQDRHPGIDVIVYEGQHRHLTAMLHDRQAELGIVAWPNLDPLVQDLEPLVIMREAAPLVVAPEIAAQLPRDYTIADVLALVPRVIALRWWQVDPDGAAALAQRAATCVELPTGPARRLVIKGAGFGVFVRSAIIDDLEEGRLVEIQPVDFEPLHRDTALVTLTPSALDRPIVRDFANEIALECEKVGTVIENRIAAVR
ncbi:LysR family transcriptional regulator [Devosia sp.]|jgi:LysR family carnitine catabolism transcriptional activator|uniref:LysR family transcriptional regulator n=1 Tax=Devosia sp. TaxID=1871048 RepID=UPI0037BE2D9D